MMNRRSHDVNLRTGYAFRIALELLGSHWI